MAETIAMTPPDIDGNQIYWTKEEDESGTIYLPPNTDPSAKGLLAPSNYRRYVADDGSCLGVGSIEVYAEAGIVHEHNGFAVKSAPFLTRDRLLDWLSANLMLQHTIASLSEDEKDYLTHEIFGLDYYIKTPQYFGALALEDTTGKSIVIMSNEDILDASVMSAALFSEFGKILEDFTVNALKSIYPGSNFKLDLDHHCGNWIIRPADRSLVRLDLYGTKREEYFPPKEKH